MMRSAITDEVEGLVGPRAEHARGTTCPIRTIEFGVAGNQILTVNEMGHVTLWGLTFSLTADVLLAPRPLLFVAPGHLLRSVGVQEQEVVEEELTGLKPSTVMFHPCLTVTGRQPAFMIGTDGGLIVK